MKDLNEMTKTHYKAPSDEQWCENEVDYNYGVHCSLRKMVLHLI